MKVFIKDTWQVDLPDIKKEGDTYVVMVAAQVKNIMPCSAAGDIGDNTTLTHLFKDEPWACKAKRVLVPHHHYQLVLDPIIVTADVTLCVGCIDRYVINMYCASHN